AKVFGSSSQHIRVETQEEVKKEKMELSSGLPLNMRLTQNLKLPQP
ncbi:unnamed protein product, partial [marine sediment metagenome]